MIGQRIKEVRKNAKCTQDQFADLLKISKNYVCLVETGRNVPGERLISQISNMFGVNETWLLTGEGDMHAPLTEAQELAQMAAMAFTEKDEDKKNLFLFVGTLEPEEIRVLKQIWKKGNKFFNNDES